jgi:uncharacterized protein YhhL (DUF1145 family)
MIQRRQSLLVVACVLAVVCVCLRQTWLDVLQVVSAALSAYTFFLFVRNQVQDTTRRLQSSLCLANIFLILVWYVGLAVTQGQPTTVDAIPMVEAILVFLARQGILGDEKKIRATERLRD